ncbi:unnamed protein product [Closterium sp. NIES-65]|nr:unnamed protein product [Closterium sp. NIES-65]
MAATRTGVYVDDFLTEVSSLPHELQRMLSLMRELDGRCQALRMEIQRDIRAGLTAIEEREAVLRAGAGAQDGHGHEGLDGHADAGGDRDGNGDGDGHGEGEGDEDDAASDSDAAEDAGNGDNESDGAVVTPAALSPATGALDEVPGGEQQGRSRGGEAGDVGDAGGMKTEAGEKSLKQGSSTAQVANASSLPPNGLLAGKADNEAGGGEKRPRGRPRKRGRGEREGVGGEEWVGGTVKVEEEVEEGGGRKSIGKKRPRAQQHQVGQQQQQQQQVLQQEAESKDECAVVKAELPIEGRLVVETPASAAPSMARGSSPHNGGGETDRAARMRASMAGAGLEEEGRGRDGRDDVSGDISDERAAALQRLREEISEKQGKMRALCDEKVILAQQVSALLESHLRSLNQELQHFSEDLKQAASPAAGVGGARGWGEPKGEGRGLSAVAVLASGSGGEGGGGGGGGVWEAKGEAWQGNQERESERGAGREAGRETGREAGREAGRDAGREREWERGGRGAALMPPPAALPLSRKKGGVSRGVPVGAGGERREVPEGGAGEQVYEPTYCICGQVSFGDMIACDNANCEGGEWFHYECVGLSIAMPRIHDKWFCPHCTSLHKKGMLHLPP